MLPGDVAEAYRGRRVLITGGLGFIGSNLAHALVELGAEVVLVDSLIPEYGGNRANIAGIEDAVRVNVSDVRDEHSFRSLIRGQERALQPRGPDEPRRLDARPVHRPRDQLPQPALDPRGLPPREPRGEGRLRQHAPALRAAAVPAGRRGSTRSCPSTSTASTRRRARATTSSTARSTGCASTVLRLTNTYGPRMRVKDDRQTFLGTWLRLAVDGEELLIFGDGTPAARLHLRRRRRRGVPARGREGRGGRRGLQPRRRSRRQPARARRAAGRGRGRRLVPARAVPGGTPVDRHRRLLRRRREDPRTARLGSPPFRLRDGLARSLEYYRERAASLLVTVTSPSSTSARQVAASRAELEDAFATRARPRPLRRRARAGGASRRSSPRTAASATQSG